MNAAFVVALCALGVGVVSGVVAWNIGGVLARDVYWGQAFRAKWGRRQGFALSIAVASLLTACVSGLVGFGVWIAS